MKVSVVGLGKLGACLLGVLATRHDVLGVDTNEATLRVLNDGAAPVEERGLGELLAENRARYRVTADFADVAETDVTFIIVPTPSIPSGEFDNQHVVKAVSAVGRAIKGKQTPHLVVITSTVMPGATLGPIRVALTSTAGRDLGPSLGLCYSPEFIALGTVIDDMRHPDMVLIGQSSAEHGDVLEELLQSVILKDAPTVRLTIPEAEIAKLGINAFITTKIAFANTLAELCEGMTNADAVNVAEAIGMDSRIGGKYLRPASAFAGPCLPRDNEAFMALARASGTIAPIAAATVTVNDRQVDRLANLVERILPVGTAVGILGMAYKPNTPVIDKSVGVGLAKEMVRRGHKVIAHDPLAIPNVRALLGASLLYADDAAELLTMVGAAVVVQPHASYRDLEPCLGDLPIVDLWGLFKNRTCFRPGIYRWGVTS